MQSTFLSKENFMKVRAIKTGQLNDPEWGPKLKRAGEVFEIDAHLFAESWMVRADADEQLVDVMALKRSGRNPYVSRTDCEYHPNRDKLK
jgi:hypothetical protein